MHVVIETQLEPSKKLRLDPANWALIRLALRQRFWPFKNHHVLEGKGQS
jgi:hypothetical protein